MGRSARSHSDPRVEYERRRESWRRAAAGARRREAWISAGRLALFLAAAGLAWICWGSDRVSFLWLALPAALFLLLAAWHDRVIRRRRRAERAIGFYRRGLARLDEAWSGEGETGLRYLQADHPFAGDLDLFGDGSIFQLLCAARTRGGERRLADWLQVPAPAAEVRSRQRAVEELAGKLGLREDLALLGDEVRAGVHPEELAAWGKAPPLLAGGPVRMALLFLSALTALSGLGGAGFGWGWRPFLFCGLLQSAVALLFRWRVGRVVAGVERAGQDLDLLAHVLERLEKESFEDERLLSLRRALDTEGVPPSRRIRRLHRWIELLDSRRNQLFAPLALILMWTTQIAFAIERWREITGPAVERWLDAVGEFEALASLGRYAFENPADPWPEIGEEGPRFEAEGIGHPLIPRDRCVRNDLHLGDGRRLFLVSGSNMSGKSTLLRTVGVNAVLALAGAPVRARRLRLSPLRVGATIRIVDSLQGGSSRFYAEITRLHHLQEMADGGPLLFLLDEILHGTNSHDRRIGAAAVLKEFLDRGGIGLVTTHDLALTAIPAELDGRAENIHFEDRFAEGKMVFDYRIRPGVVRKSNALALMRSVGLQVGD